MATALRSPETQLRENREVLTVNSVGHCGCCTRAHAARPVLCILCISSLRGFLRTLFCSNFKPGLLCPWELSGLLEQKRSGLKAALSVRTT